MARDTREFKVNNVPGVPSGQVMVRLTRRPEFPSEPVSVIDAVFRRRPVVASAALHRVEAEVYEGDRLLFTVVGSVHTSKQDAEVEVKEELRRRLSNQWWQPGDVFELHT
jgi:hypothetical protein